MLKPEILKLMKDVNDEAGKDALVAGADADSAAKRKRKIQKEADADGGGGEELEQK